MWFRIVAVSIVVLMFGGCRSGVGIREEIAPDGMPVRLEVAEEEAAAIDPALVTTRLNAHRARRLRVAHPRPAGAAAIAPAGDDSFDPFVERGCPPEGSATTERQERLNRLKNRMSEPTGADLDPEVTLEELRRPGDDRDRWSTGMAATIEGYVLDAKATGAESCNCHATERRLTDTHLDIAEDADDTRQPVIAEITPVWRLIHEHQGLENWSSKAVRDKYKGHRVRITGWLFFDEAHLYEADNTDPYDTRGKANWRATCWEIHPITDIQLLEE